MCVVLAPGYIYNEDCLSEVSGFLAMRRLPQVKLLIKSYSNSIADGKSKLGNKSITVTNDTHPDLLPNSPMDRTMG